MEHERPPFKATGLASVRARPSWTGKGCGVWPLQVPVRQCPSWTDTSTPGESVHPLISVQDGHLRLMSDANFADLSYGVQSSRMPYSKL